MDSSETEGEGPLSLWKVYNSLAVNLFKDLDQAAPGLETMMTSIINVHNNIQDILVPKFNTEECIKHQYTAFNKWLLSRTFYILTDMRLISIHDLSIQVQLLILSVLHSSGASFHIEILQDYSKAFQEIINYYQKSEQEEDTLVLNILIPESTESLLDLSPITIKIRNKITARNTIICLMKILSPTCLKTRVFVLYSEFNEIIYKNIINIYQHLDLVLKSSALNFFVKFLEDCELNKSDKFISTFLNLTEKFVQTLPLIVNLQEHEKELQEINSQLKQMLGLFLKEEINRDYKKTLNNIVEFILTHQANANLNMNCKFSEDVCKLCTRFVEKSVLCGSFLETKPFSNCDKISKTTPMIYIEKLINEVMNSNRNHSKILNVWECSESFQNLHSKIFQSLEKAGKENINLVVFSAHLSQLLNLLNTLCNFKTIIKIQYDKGNILNINTCVDIHIFSADMSREFLKLLMVALKNNLHRCTQPLNEITSVMNIFTKLLMITHNMNISDIITILEFELFSNNIETNTHWLSILFRNCNIQFDIEAQQSVLLKILLSQQLILPRNLYITKFKEQCVDLLNMQLNNPSRHVKLEIIRCSPLILLNNIMAPEELITKYLYPSYLSKDPILLYDLALVLPTLVCIVLQTFTIIENVNDIRKKHMGHEVNLAFGINFYLLCSQCHSKYEHGQLTNESIEVPHESTGNYPEHIVKRLKCLFKEFLYLNKYTNVSQRDLSRIVINFSKHSIIVPSCLDYMLRSDNIKFVIEVLEPFVSNILIDSTLDETQKNDMMNSIVTYILKMSKISLENNNENQQDNCLECVRRFGKIQSQLVILPSVKICIVFVMNHNSLYGPKAALYVREICEAHNTTTVEVYHKYKKDFCRVIMEFAAYNYLMDHENTTWCIAKVVQVFGFVGFRDFVSKDIHHALPYLIPLVIQCPKLKAIVEQIAFVTNYSVADFMSERFPHIYTHIYLTENERISKKCFDYIEEVTQTQITQLIKKHFRVILTEFLLQYCCEPERVLKACRWLAMNDPEYTPKQADVTLSLSQVAEFIQPRFLGVLAYIDSKLVNAKVAMSIKRKALQSFPQILNLMGSKHMTPLRFKILAILRTALTLILEYPLLNATAWNAFIHNIDTSVLGPLLSSIFVSLLPLLDKAKKETNEIFEYLVVKNENLLSLHIPDLFFIEDDNVAQNVCKVISRHVKRVYPQNFIEKITWLLKYLNHDSSEIRVYTFKHLLSLIKESQIDINNALFGSKDIHPTIIELIDILIAGCRDKDLKVSEYSGRCLGALGAVEPSLLPRHSSLQSSTDSSAPFAFSISDHHFMKQALTELTRAFHTEKHTKNMDCYALAIQEILKAFNISPDGQNKDLWDTFPDNMHQIMLPLLSSRYTLAVPSNPKGIHPVYGSNDAATFNEWALNWTSELITHIDCGFIQDVLKKVHPSLRRDLSTLVLFLPYIVLHAILSSNNDKNIREEIMAVVGADSFNHDNESNVVISKYKIFIALNMTPNITPLVHEEGTQLRCRKMVYILLDFLNRWLLEWTHDKKDAFKDDNYVKVKTFLKSFCNLTVARGNFLCGELERSLQYLEMYVEGSQARLHEQLAFLAEIYTVLNEPDCVAGIMRMKQSEPSLRELVLAHKVTGQLQDAATCYEKSAQEGDLDNETLQGMVEVYLGLDQPFTALSLLQGTNIRAEGGLAAEPMWRLGRFEDLDKLLGEPDVKEDRQWGVRVGHCLLALRKGERKILENNLCTAREALLTRLGETTSSTAEIRRVYTHSYQNALGLHMLDEIEHLETLIYKIKSIPDHNSECGNVIEQLIMEWDLRLRLVQASSKTVEPVLRLRRILLEQAKELFTPSHPQTISSLNSQIGKIWLQSAKFARKASIFQQAYIYILNAEKYSPKDLFIEKAKLYWERGQQEPAFYTLKRGLEEHFPSISQLSPNDRKICARAKLLIAKYNDMTSNVDMDVNIVHYKEAVEANRQWEKSLVHLAEYYEKVYNASSSDEKNQSIRDSTRAQALNCYGKALQYGHTRLYQSMPRMLSIWLDFEVQSTDPKSQSMATLKQICTIIDTFSKRLPLYLFLTAFSQIISRICHPIKEVYDQLKSIIIELILAYPHHSLWMMMCVIKSSYPQRIKRCQDILGDPRLKQQSMTKFIYDFNQLAEKLIELCNKPIAAKIQSTQVSTLVRSLPKLLSSDNFSQIMMPHEQFVKVVLPLNSVNKIPDKDYNPFPNMVYIADIEESVVVFPSLQRPRRITFRGSDGKKYNVMLKPKDDLRKDFRLMEFNGVVNRYLQENSEARERRLYIRTYSVLPLNEECGILEWVNDLTGLRPILMQLYKEKGKFTALKELKEMMCSINDPLSKKKHVFEKMLLPKHPPVFDTWFRYTFPDPHTWYQARSAYIRTTAVMSMVGYILGLGDRHGENILFDSKSGDTVHVDFNCLFNKGESFEWPERVPFRLTHNMTHAMGPLGCEGMYRKCCEITLRVLKSQTSTLMSVIRPFVYDPLVVWQKHSAKDTSTAERTNQLAKDHLIHIKQRLQGMIMTKDKQFSLSLSPEGQANNLILEATNVNNLCQMYIGWGPFL